MERVNLKNLYINPPINFDFLINKSNLEFVVAVPFLCPSLHYAFSWDGWAHCRLKANRHQCDFQNISIRNFEKQIKVIFVNLTLWKALKRIIFLNKKTPIPSTRVRTLRFVLRRLSAFPQLSSDSNSFPSQIQFQMCPFALQYDYCLFSIYFEKSRTNIGKTSGCDFAFAGMACPLLRSICMRITVSFSLLDALEQLASFWTATMPSSSFLFNLFTLS